MVYFVVVVLEKLGVHSASPTLAFNAPATNSLGTPESGTRTKAAIVERLSAATAEDIEGHENEQRQTYQRATGSMTEHMKVN
jgi:hypothetical protein